VVGLDGVGRLPDGSRVYFESERVYIGGDIMMTSIHSGGRVIVRRVHRFEHYDEHWEAMSWRYNRLQTDDDIVL
jgi:hypothetical protein